MIELYDMLGWYKGTNSVYKFSIQWRAVAWRSTAVKNISAVRSPWMESYTKKTAQFKRTTSTRKNPVPPAMTDKESIGEQLSRLKLANTNFTIDRSRVQIATKFVGNP
ncbi:hypothetical protein N7535_008191 [Penicillium sp. DV-2018c]|nr:hypothetical protein N7461_004228 [Penicillium sp. DV-2018c]KAJ5566553.1 hypothetical protein N7535_008191 [Penicillium sp. DV-2018c]